MYSTLGVIVFVLVLAGIGYGSGKILDNSIISKKYHYIIQLVLMGLAIVGMVYSEKYLTKTYGDHIGSFFETADYTANYYINVFESEKSSKNYELPAEIYRSDVDGAYQVNYFTWPNGGYISFGNNKEYSPLKINEKIKIEDDDGKTWYIQLTKKRVK